MPAEERLQEALGAIDRFASRVAMLEHDREEAEHGGTTDTVALERKIAVAQHDLEVAEFAEHAIRMELAEPGH